MGKCIHVNLLWTENIKDKKAVHTEVAVKFEKHLSFEHVT